MNAASNAGKVVVKKITINILQVYGFFLKLYFYIHRKIVIGNSM